MTQRLAHLSDAELAGALTDAGRSLPYPDVDVAPLVVRRLAAVPAAAGRARARARSPRRLVAVAALLVGLLATSAVAARVGVPGIGIRFDAPPAATSPPIATDQLFLGDPISLRSAQAAVDFELHVPRHPGLPAPQALLQRAPGGDRVSLVYAAAAGLPPIEGTDVGLLVTQFPGTVEADLLEKIAQERSQVSPVTIGGHPGWWIEGAHTILYVAPDGQIAEERLRLASSTLLWHWDGTTVRLESALAREQALGIAESMTGD